MVSYKHRFLLLPLFLLVSAVIENSQTDLGYALMIRKNAVVP